jgi:hypothetical protein
VRAERAEGPSSPDRRGGLGDERPLEGAVKDGADAVRDGAREATQSRQMAWVARAGVAAHGAVYLLLGIVALLVAFDESGQNVDQRGAFKELASTPPGLVLLAALTAGCAAYTLWLVSQAVFGTADEGDKRLPRVQSAMAGAGYLLLTVSAATVLFGSRTSQAGTQEALTARVMAVPGGVVLVMLAGLFVLGLGAFMVYQAVTAEFMRHFRPMPRALEPVVRQLGRVGSLGRGVVIGLAGGLVVSAALTFDPAKARGIDLAFRETLQQPYGRPLAVAAAAALLAFGLYGIAEAVYRRV